MVPLRATAGHLFGVTYKCTHRGKAMNFPFKIVEVEGLPEGTILLVPETTMVKHVIQTTGETTTTFEFNQRAAGIIENATSSCDVETKKMAHLHQDL